MLLLYCILYSSNTITKLYVIHHVYQQVDVKKAAEGATAIQDRKYKKELKGKDKEYQSRMKVLIKLHRTEKDELLDEVDVSLLV